MGLIDRADVQKRIQRGESARVETVGKGLETEPFITAGPSSEEKEGAIDRSGPIRRHP